MRVRSLRQQRGDAHEDESGVVKTVFSGNNERLARRGRRRNDTRADCAVVGHDAKDTFRLRRRLVLRRVVCIRRWRGSVRAWLRLAGRLGMGCGVLRLRRIGQRGRGHCGARTRLPAREEVRADRGWPSRKTRLRGRARNSIAFFHLIAEVGGSRRNLPHEASRLGGPLGIVPVARPSGAQTRFGTLLHHA